MQVVMAESVLHTMLFSYLVNVRNQAYSFEESIFSPSQVASWFSPSKYWFIANCWPPVHCSISWASHHTSWCVWWSLMFNWSFLYMFSFSCRLCLSSQHKHIAQYCTQCSTAALQQPIPQHFQVWLCSTQWVPLCIFKISYQLHII